MKIYQASLFLQVMKKYWEIFKEPLNVLLSYAMMGGETEGFLEENRHMVGSIIADSGAWSFAQGTKSFRIENLISYLQLWGNCFDRYFNFDTDFTNNGFENNIANQIRMEREGLHPVPVIHNFYDEEIEYYVNSGKYEWLALGSSQSTNFDAMKYAVDRIKPLGKSDIKIHWFGGSKFDWLCNLPITSCDTTSWVKMGSMGWINYWNPHEKKFYKAHKIYVSGQLKIMSPSEYHFVTYPWREELEDYLQNTFGLTYGDLCGYGDKFNMQLINTRFYAELEKRINSERINIGIPLE